MKHYINCQPILALYPGQKKTEENVVVPNNLRKITVGRVGKVLFVVCTLREKNTVRIISVRTASLPERERYEDGECEF